MVAVGRSVAGNALRHPVYASEVGRPVGSGAHHCLGRKMENDG